MNNLSFKKTEKIHQKEKFGVQLWCTTFLGVLVSH